MPDAIAGLIARVQRRWLLRTFALAISVAGAVFAAALWLASPGTAAALAILAGGLMVARGGRLSNVDAAAAIESATPALDNLIITTTELDVRPRPVRAGLREEILRQALERASAVDPARVVPLLQPVAVAAAVAIGCGVLTGAGGPKIASRISDALDGPSSDVRAGSFDVRIVPPAYTKRQSETIRDPIQITVLSGSRIQVAAAGRDWIATESAASEIAIPGAGSRFLSVIVVPDLPPSVRVVEPGKDTAFAEPRGELAIGLQSGDDLGLVSLVLRFTKASGGGENVSFTEGELPLRIERRSERDWVGHTDVSLTSLGLADGDILVYRAIARDTNPSGSPVQSDQYLIEIGKTASIADAGFALPSEEKKYAISQQMVIYRTEQLLRDRQQAGAEFLEQSQAIGVEQRMVRAEVVFLSGGEIEDEVEEAAKSDELTEGRLQNSGRAEMLRAINAMSRAEAQLNDGRVREALVYEREALVHLERALDRRRYFLRTLPDRSRIDPGRRLTGDRREARSWDREEGRPAAPRSIEAQRRVMRELAAGTSLTPALAARIAAIDPASGELQKAAVALASASTEAGRQAAARAAMSAVTNHALGTLPAAAAIDLRLDPLAGRLADEVRRRQ